MATFTHDYWRATRDDWKTLGLHWHCHSWTGDPKVFGSDAIRRDNSTDVTPVMVKEWLNKPARLIRQAPRTPEEAVAWLRAEFDRYASQMVNNQATFVPVETRFGRALHDLQCGNDISWAFWLNGASSIASMSVVGTAECRIH